MPAIKTLNEDLLAGIVPGTWAAISENQEKVVAVGQSVEEVLKHAREAGEENPFVIRVPLKNSALML
jgi:hypothetical protein